jgi:hypothetical protein
MEPLCLGLPVLLISQQGCQNKQDKELNGLIIIINVVISLEPVGITAFQGKPSTNGKRGILNTTYLL